MFYLITYISNVAYERIRNNQATQLQERLREAEAAAKDIELPDEQEVAVLIKTKIEDSLLVICFVMIFFLCLQLAAVANQRRYRISFYSSVSLVLMSVLVWYCHWNYTYNMGLISAGYMTKTRFDAAEKDWPAANEGEEIVREMKFGENNPLNHIEEVASIQSTDFFTLMVIAIVRLSLFVRRPYSLFVRKHKSVDSVQPIAEVDEKKEEEKVENL